jgi:hypothetical protein
LVEVLDAQCGASLNHDENLSSAVLLVRLVSTVDGTLQRP